MLIMITGEERLLMDQKVAALKQQYPITLEEMNFNRIDCRETPIDELLQEISGVPFFSAYRMIVLTHPYFYTTEKVKGEQAKETASLTEALCHTPDNIIVILFVEGKLDERKKQVKALRKAATVIECRHPDSHRLRSSTRQAFKKRHAQIDDAALDLLLARAGDSLLHIQNETEKLCLYTDHITLDDVYMLVNKPLEENAFELANALLKKNFAKVMGIYRDLRQKNEEPIRLIALLASSLRSLYQVTLLDRKGYNDQEIGQYLGMNPYRLRYIRMDSRNFELNDLLKMLSELSRLDISIKQGKVDKYQGFELFLLQLVKK